MSCVFETNNKLRLRLLRLQNEQQPSEQTQPQPQNSAAAAAAASESCGNQTNSTNIVGERERQLSHILFFLPINLSTVHPPPSPSLCIFLMFTSSPEIKPCPAIIVIILHLSAPFVAGFIIAHRN
ncbi:hypothetical protein DY000_02060326 [Brassica cretica]|uniref:Uncharacterized protein n=1 Tax=Brassica cretica TaxID=69181 RepID=A0ABQ7B2D3_BRACR|nr:hypothetical protein DY000_02060326 [Brassica cretica]